MTNWADILDECDGQFPDEPWETNSADFDDEPLSTLPEGVVLQLFESNWPELYVSREGSDALFELTEHIYTKFWWHKYHARVFVDAMLRAVRRMTDEGAPFESPKLDSDDDVHLFVRWTVRLDASESGSKSLKIAKEAFDAVWERANRILDDSDSVLVLGKDTGESLERLKLIGATLESAGFHVYIIKQEPDRLGESVLQKVLRYALSSRFVLIENTEPSGHLYEIPHVAKMAECVVAVLQQRGKGATWMFEDAYFRHNHWTRFEYDPDSLAEAVRDASQWALDFLTRFGAHQQAALPWMKPTTPS